MFLWEPDSRGKLGHSRIYHEPIATSRSNGNLHGIWDRGCWIPIGLIALCQPYGASTSLRIHRWPSRPRRGRPHLEHPTRRPCIAGFPSARHGDANPPREWSTGPHTTALRGCLDADSAGNLSLICIGGSHPILFPYVRCLDPLTNPHMASAGQYNLRTGNVSNLTVFEPMMTSL